jgi:hypothetical protein
MLLTWLCYSESINNDNAPAKGVGRIKWSRFIAALRKH